jgi:hypothetical protein
VGVDEINESRRDGDGDEESRFVNEETVENEGLTAVEPIYRDLQKARESESRIIFIYTSTIANTVTTAVTLRRAKHSHSPS